MTHQLLSKKTGMIRSIIFISFFTILITLMATIAYAQGTINSGRIAFHSYTEYSDDPPYDGIYSLDGEIHIYNLNSNTPYTLGQNAIRAEVDHAMNPKFSPDGSRIVFMGLPKNNHPTDKDWAVALDIWLYDFRTNAPPLNLSEQAGLTAIEEDPNFSPDGTKVVFKKRFWSTERECEPSEDWVSELWELSLSGFSLKQLTDTPCVEESGPEYSPDGNWILFWVGDGAGAYIGKIPSLAESIKEIIEVHDNEEGDSPGIQDYFPSYWGDDKIIYTSWDTPQYYPIKDDDDIKIYNIMNQQPLIRN
jgi:hypothetical protein